MIKVNNTVIPIERFPDGTCNVKGNPILCNGVVVLSWHYENDAEFIALGLLTKYYQAHNNVVNLYLPYIPNARMDRVESDSDVFAMKYFGEMINSLDFRMIYALDPHSSVALASIKNVKLLNANFIVDYIIDELSVELELDSEEIIMFYPDEGAMKRYSKKTNNSFAFGMKKRDWKTGKILNLEILGMNAKNICGKNFLIRDDICSKGGTFYYAAKKLKELGANKIYLYVTHCENSVLNGEFGEDKKNLLDTGLIERLYTTNSICTIEDKDNDKIRIMNFNVNMTNIY